MNRKILYLICSTLVCCTCAAQAQRENFWYFGTLAGLDFTSGAPVAIMGSMSTPEACASVSDPAGNLLFYSNGQRIWDRFGNIMQNGFTIIPTGYNIVSTTQGVSIVPMPGSTTKYYVFSLTAIEEGPNKGRLYYCIVDMNLNNGLGAVVPGQVEILVHTGLKEAMTTVAGANCNIWLLTIAQSGQLKAFSIDDAGVDTVPVLSPMLPVPPALATGKHGSICVSPDRKKLGVADIHLSVYDFDHITGTISNPVLLSQPSNDGAYYSVAFSPNSTILYGGASGLMQFDLSSGIASTILASGMSLGYVCSGLKLGPDNKIYFISGPGPSLSVINQPNLPGPACNVQLQAVQLLMLTYSYLGLPTPIADVLPTGDTLYSTQIVDVPDCFTETFEIVADTAGRDMMWDNGTNNPHRLVGAGTYWVRYEKRCVVYIDTFKVRFPNATPIIQTTPACKGLRNASARALVFEQGYAFTWRNLAGDTLSLADSLVDVPGGYYTLHVVTPLGCDTNLQVFLPEVDYQASFSADSFVCQGSAAVFNNTSDNHFTDFQWSFGDGQASGQFSPLHLYADTGTYIVQLIAQGPICTETFNRSITVDPLLMGDFLSKGDSVCTGDRVTFIVADDPSIRGLDWDFGNGNGMPTEPGQQLTHSFDQEGQYTITLTTHYRACPATTYTRRVDVFPLPLVNLGPDTSLCLNGRALLLQNAATNNLSQLQYLWSTGDTTPILSVTAPGEYSLRVSAGLLPCSNTESITVAKDCYVDIPNAFTPNGDGENDYFLPRQLLSHGLQQFSMQIINRWGQVLFQTRRTDGRGWDGRFNGQDQPQGVYVFLIRATLANGFEETYTGNVTLLR